MHRLTVYSAIAGGAATDSISLVMRGEGAETPAEKPADTATQHEATLDDLQPIIEGLLTFRAVGPYDGLDCTVIEQGNYASNKIAAQELKFEPDLMLTANTVKAVLRKGFQGH